MAEPVAPQRPWLIGRRDDQASYAVVNPDGSFDWESFYRDSSVGTESEWEQVIREERESIAS